MVPLANPESDLRDYANGIAHEMPLVSSSKNKAIKLLMNAEAITDIDVTAAQALLKLQSELEHKGIVLVIARASQPLQQMLKRSGLTERIGSERIYPSVRTGVQAYLERKGELAGKSGERVSERV